MQLVIKGLRRSTGSSDFLSYYIGRLNIFATRDVLHLTAPASRVKYTLEAGTPTVAKYAERRLRRDVVPTVQSVLQGPSVQVGRKPTATDSGV